jgi:hypothetical protein
MPRLSGWITLKTKPRGRRSGGLVHVKQVTRHGFDGDLPFGRMMANTPNATHFCGAVLEVKAKMGIGARLCSQKFRAEKTVCLLENAQIFRQQ